MKKMNLLKTGKKGTLILGAGLALAGFLFVLSPVEAKAEPATTTTITSEQQKKLEEDKKKALESGMRGHVSKPIDVKELLQAIRSALD